MPRSPALSLSGCSSLFSLSSTSTSRDNDSASAAAPPVPVPAPVSLHPLPPRRPLLSLSVGGEDDDDEEEEYLLGGLDLQLTGAGASNSCCDGDDERKNIRMMKNRESALRSRARKRAYVQELEKEVRRLVNENLKLKRQCKQPKNRRDILLEYVKNVQPEFMELFIKKAPAQVVEAMRQTVTNMLGTLPPQFFAVTVTTVAENLAQLMYSVLMTGYMFRNAQYRLELQQSLEQIALPEPKEEKDSPDYAPGTQKKVSGEVIRWNKATGPEKIDAVKYIELLEAEIDELSRQVARKSSQGSNELLEYLKSLEPQNIKELTNTAGEDVVFAMNTFIKRLLSVSDPAQMKTTVSETSANQLANLLFWLMIVGYSMRNIEVRFDMERVLGAPPKVAELPPGETM